MEYCIWYCYDCSRVDGGNHADHTWGQTVKRQKRDYVLNNQLNGIGEEAFGMINNVGSFFMGAHIFEQMSFYENKK